MAIVQRLARIALGVVLGASAWVVYGQSGSELKDTGADDYFSSDYQEARKKFLESAQAVGASIESLENTTTGPEGERLFADVALIGQRDSNTVLVLISGTHGVEGFAGSAIQTGLMREGIASSLKQDTSILMIHAINPYGFAHLRRFDEDNVDLNRNFLDHLRPHPKNPAYDALADFIAPKTMNFFSRVVLWPRLLWYKATGRTRELQQAISGGQYSHPDGLFYGGRFETWSNKTIQSIIHRYLSSASRVIVLDFHTGLGQYGDYEIILQHPEESPIYRRAVAIWGQEKMRTTFNGASNQDNGETTDTPISVELRGPMKLAFSKLLPEAEVTAVTVEQGTSSMTKVFLALREENWLHHHGDPLSTQGKKIKTTLRKAFYPDTNDWKQMVWSGAKRVIYQALKSGSQ